MKMCSIDGCEKELRARGLCGTHWARWRKTGTTDDPEPKYKSDFCSIDGCDKHRKTLGLCEMHYYRRRRNGRTGPPTPLITRNHGNPCKVDGCAKPGKSFGMCEMHYTRFTRNGHTERIRRSGFTIDANGYYRVHVNGKPCPLHRKAMEDHLGRKLTREEVVHHVDRDKSNNNISNLMLMKNHSEHKKLHWKEDKETGQHPEHLPRDNDHEKRFHSLLPGDNFLKNDSGESPPVGG